MLSVQGCIDWPSLPTDSGFCLVGCISISAWSQSRLLVTLHPVSCCIIVLTVCNCVQVFCDEKHGEIAAAHPQEKGRKVYSLLVAAWRDCSLKDRAKYEKLSQVCRRLKYRVKPGMS